MMDQIYNDFTTKLLPSIQAGLSITKDYFLDLFGRYVKYLIVSDAIMLGVCVLAFFILPIIAYKTHKYGMIKAGSYSSNYDEVWPFFIVVASVIFWVICNIGLFVNGDHLIKDIYIPEIRVYEELKPAITHKE